ncbi:preprotein translocase subunit SecE [Garciella nitratireducens]|uniref:Protein translocase subunit SecE n=1 Tax=Garciella nitratireducens DSM 15102 TaxID=1121911 RepID=A0A1T4PUM5_9FIRM|nr:preprotein translocase subunit SecE [Garciella nitratireducens]RBP44865.1 preprotein translocase subunit SecE [Garciella nitratireducens]SJZ94977.1 preprotein translocase subunit SecE [Garciella nitratireducens DSM 15102]
MAKGKKAKVKNKKKKNKNGLGLVAFLKSVWKELKKVNWPSRKELIQHTGVVIVSIAIVAIVVWIMDLGLSSILNMILG